ncbi:MAG: molybdate ABC transporter substrate-binding protein [Phycisphaerales bacterium]
MRSHALHLLIVACIAMAGCDRGAAPQANATPSGATVTVFAASSATDVLREAGHLYEVTHKGAKITFSFDASSNLARQIKAGAPADLFLSADERWMDDVVAAGAVDQASRIDLLGNALVMVAPVGRSFELTMSKDFRFTEALPAVRRIAVGDPAHVPAGRYARQALESLGWWASVEPLLLPAPDVRAALRLVESCEADAGIVFATDAKSSAKVVVVAEFPDDSHEPIRYPIAITRHAKPDATDFVEFLRGPAMAKVFESAGFRVLAPASDSNAESR